MRKIRSSDDYYKSKQQCQQLFAFLCQNYYQALETACKIVNYKLQDLGASKPQDFVSKGTPALSAKIRFNHYQQRRLAKIMKLLSLVIPQLQEEQDQTLITMIGSYELPSRSSRTVSPGANSKTTYSNPKAFMETSYIKEQLKHQKSMRTLRNITRLQYARQNWVKGKIKKFQNRDQKLQEEKKKKMKQHLNWTDTRNQHRSKRYQIKQQIEEEQQQKREEYSKQLEARYQTLEGKEKQKKKKIENLKQKEILDKTAKQIKEKRKERQEKAGIGKLIESFQDKMNTHQKINEQMVNERVHSARQHSQRVQKKFTAAQKEVMRQNQEKMRWMIDKQNETNKKVQKKQEISRDFADKIKNKLQYSFNKQLLQKSKLMTSIQTRNKNIQDKLFSREKVVQQTRKLSQQEISRNRASAYSKKRENHSRAFSTQTANINQFKQRVLDKHKRLAGVAQDLKFFKYDLADKKRANNLEVQKYRSVVTSPFASRNKS